MNYAVVPKEWQQNLEWREKCNKFGQKSRAFREDWKEACRKDILFWLASSCWTFDPRKAASKRRIPWIPYPFQEEALPQIKAAMGHHDLGIEKSRTMTATWMILACFVHEWEFFQEAILGVASSKEALVDAGDDPDCLFWKMRFLLKTQPSWLIDPDQYRSIQLSLKNHETGSVLSGYSTTEEIGRGGRKLAFMIDEYAAYEPSAGYAVDSATYAVTPSRIFNSTYKGATGCFYDKMRGKKKVPHIISLPWYRHPDYAQGLVYNDKGKPTSPWYESEQKRIVVDAMVKSELDMDPLGSSTQFFPPELLEEKIQNDCRPAYYRGRISGGVFVEDAQGPLSLWMHPHSGLAPFGDRYSVGCDVGMGTGASNSVASAASQETGEKVAELVTAHMGVDEFCEAVVELAKWLNEAFLIWENHGPGVRFGRQLVEKGYRNIFYRQNEESLSRKQTDTPGWSATEKNKRLLFGTYITALREGSYVNRSEEALRECRLITLSPTGKIVNSTAAACADPSGAGENHADRPTADALSVKGLTELGPKPQAEVPVDLPPDPSTFEGRRAIRAEARSHEDEW